MGIMANSLKKNRDMTKEDKELLLKDLCARIPYGVKIELHGEVCTVFGCVDDYVQCTANVPTDQQTMVTNVKPYLRPMSSMTDDEEREFISLKCKIVTYTHGYNCILSLDELDWLNSHHFDYRGLIPMGLALEAPEGMYKTE